MGNLNVIELGRNDAPRISQLVQQYSDLPMDFADAALVAACEREGITTVFTFDRDFSIYRPAHTNRFEIVP